MKTFLLDKIGLFDFYKKLTPSQQELVKDCELDNILNVMAGNDKYIYNSSLKILTTPVYDKETIYYRQEILKDFIEHFEVLKELYDCTAYIVEKHEKDFWLMSNNPMPKDFIILGQLLKLYFSGLRSISNIVKKNKIQFKSEGIKNLFILFNKELNDEYLNEVEILLSEIDPKKGVLLSAKLGKYCQGIEYTLRKIYSTTSKREIRKERYWWFASPFFRIDFMEGDSVIDLNARKDAAYNSTLVSIINAAENLRRFFQSFRNETAFYIGAFNLYQKIKNIGMPLCFPKVSDKQFSRSFNEAYDLSLALQINARVIGNDMSNEDTKLYVITGANQGGKTTFLRSLVQCTLMMQAGIFVPAESYRSYMTKNVFTHFRKEEDINLDSGKLDEELVRMKNIISQLSSGSLVILNESFASTNEIEGSEILMQIVLALIESDVEVIAVTHLFEFADRVNKSIKNHTVFYRAERLEDGSRSFKLKEGLPIQTAYADDIYKMIFGE